MYMFDVLSGSGNKFTAELSKEYGLPPVKIKSPEYKPGVQQIWWDIVSNRSFCLLYYDGTITPRRLFENHKPLLDIMNCELITVLEVEEIETVANPT